MNPDGVSVAYRTEVYRERAQAVQNAVALEAEADESSIQLLRLAETRQQIQNQFDRTEKEFDGGRVFSPVNGVVATHLARAGETVVAGSSIAEVFQAGDFYVDWYIPDFRLVDPQPGYRVVVGIGRNRVLGTISEILPISDTIEDRRSSILRQRGQVARIRLDSDVHPPALNATVQVYMYYTDIASRVAETFVHALS